MVRTYGGYERVLAIDYLDEVCNLMIGPESYARLEYQLESLYDNRLSRELYYDAGNEPILISKGYDGIAYKKACLQKNDTSTLKDN